MKRYVVLFTAVVLSACSSDEPRSTRITLWHFWSEPAQQQALGDRVREYESLHPGVTVDLVPLSWADGKAKLQLAFNAGTQPDVIHIGLDWFAEFDASDVFVNVGGDELVHGRGKMWVRNARALVRWTGESPNSSWGFARSDAHNVVKRCLPFLWKAGAPNFYSRLPIHATMDDALVIALLALRDTVANGALLEPSRNLDERFLRGEVRSIYTGPWIVDMASRQSVTSLEIVPQRSIMNADVLTVTTGSSVRPQAMELITWLTSYQQAAAFCSAVSDAGFPASDSVFSDARFTERALQRGFLETVRLSSPLPVSPKILSIEPIIEELIERCYTAADLTAIQRLVADARQRVRTLEER